MRFDFVFSQVLSLLDLFSYNQIIMMLRERLILCVMHHVGRRDGAIIGPSMGNKFPSGRRYRVKRIGGRIKCGIPVLIVAKPDWFGSEDVDFIIKRIIRIRVIKLFTCNTIMCVIS